MKIMTLRIVGLFFVLVSTMAIAQEAETSGGAPPEVKTVDRIATTDPVVKGEAAKADDVRAVSDHSKSSQLTRATREKLQATVSIEYVDVPFADVKRELEDRYGFQIGMDQTAIDDSLTEDDLVSVRLRGIRLADALQFMLHEFNATYVIDGGVIRIISLDNVDDREFQARRMIDVKSVLKLIELTDSRTRNAPGSPEGQTPLAARSILVQAIADLVAGDQWPQNAEGRAVVVGSVLILRGSEDLMNEVADFVNDLEAELSAASNAP